MRKILIILGITSFMLTGCKEKKQENNEPPVENQEVQHLQDYQEPEESIAFIDDYAEEIQPVLEEPDPVVYADISEYTFTNRKNIKYHCSLNNDSYNIKTTITENKSIEGPYTYDLDFSVYQRVKNVITEMDGYDDKILETVCASLGVEDVDKDEWLGYMVYSMSRGQEAHDGSTYYDSGYETLEELELVVKEYEKNIAGYAEPEEDDDYDYAMEENIKKKQEAGGETEENEKIEESEANKSSEITIEKISTADPDICAFYVNNSVDDIHHVSDGLITPDALRLFLKNHSILDKAPITVSDTNNYYLYVYGYNDVKLKNITKMIAPGMIGVMGEVEYKHDKSENYKEVYVIIPVDKTIFFSNTAITSNPM